MLGVYWGGVNRITIFLYIFIILFLPFSPIVSTILLFALVSFWTRLPGVGIPVIGKWLIAIDTVDIFSLILSVNINGIVGGIFSIIVNIGSGAIGKYTYWRLVITDAISQFIVCLIIPFIHSFTGNIFLTMIWYTVLRSIILIPFGFFFSPNPFPVFLSNLTLFTIFLTFVNSTYAGIFGTLFDELLVAGAKFSWVLFFIVSFMIGVGWFYLKKMKIRKGPQPVSHDYG